MKSNGSLKLMVLCSYAMMGLLPVRAAAQFTSDTAWTIQISGTIQTLWAVSAVSRNVAWICGNGGVVFRTTNEGVTWLGAGVLPDKLTTVAGLNSTTAIVGSGNVSTGSAKIWKTTDAGESWVVKDSSIRSVYQIRMMSGDVGYYFALRGGNNVVYRTTNGGETWIDSVFQRGGAWPMFWLDTSTGWIGTDDGIEHGLNITTNGGSAWSFEPTSFSIGPFSGLQFSSANDGIIAIVGRMLRTTNAGVTWNSLPRVWVSTAYSMARVPHSQEYWAVADASVYYSSDFGESWTNSSVHGYPGQQLRFLNEISLVTENGDVFAWVAGGVGTIVHYRRIATRVGGNPGMPHGFALSQNYPNPFNPKTVIHYQLSNRVYVQLRVFDLLGHEVRILVDRMEEPGNHEAAFDAAGLTSGVYFYRIQAGDFVQTKKLILMK